MGPKVLSNFVIGVCKSPADWIMTDYAEEFIKSVRETVGPDGHVIGAVSGGVDSTVAAVLLKRAIGDRFHAVLVDNGCLRKDEATKVLKRLREDCGINLICHDASDLFLGKLKGVTDPEKKRKIIGGTFIDVFQIEADKVGAPLRSHRFPFVHTCVWPFCSHVCVALLFTRVCVALLFTRVCGPFVHTRV